MGNFRLIDRNGKRSGVTCGRHGLDAARRRGSHKWSVVRAVLGPQRRSDRCSTPGRCGCQRWHYRRSARVVRGQRLAVPGVLCWSSARRTGPAWVPLRRRDGRRARLAHWHPGGTTQRVHHPTRAPPRLLRRRGRLLNGATRGAPGLGSPATACRLGLGQRDLGPQTRGATDGAAARCGCAPRTRAGIAKASAGYARGALRRRGGAAEPWFRRGSAGCRLRPSIAAQRRLAPRHARSVSGGAPAAAQRVARTHAPLSGWTEPARRGGWHPVLAADDRLAIAAPCAARTRSSGSLLLSTACVVVRLLSAPRADGAGGHAPRRCNRRRPLRGRAL